MHYFAQSLLLLSKVDEQLSEHISSLEDKSSEEFAALKDANSSLKNQIAELEKDVNEQLSKTTDWVNGTFATIEQYEAAQYWSDYKSYIEPYDFK